MGKSSGTKRFAQLARKLVVISDLMADTINEIEQYDEINEGEFRQDLLKVKKRCTDVVESAFELDSVQKSTYIGEMCNKLDTMIRKNFDIKDEVYKPYEESHGGLGREADEINHYQGAM